MPVDDLWYLRKRADDGTRVPTTRHGRGKRWRVRWIDPSGRRRSGLFDRKADADDHDAAVRADVARGTYVDRDAGKVYLKVYGAQWLDAQTFDPSTRETVTLRLRLHVCPYLGDQELGSLAQRPSLVQAWARRLTGQLAPNYVRTVFGNLSAVLSAAVADGLIPRNPCRLDSVKPPVAERRRVIPWSVSRVEQVRAGLPDRYQALVELGEGCGLRQGEALGLGEDDVDWVA
jgi:integrase